MICNTDAKSSVLTKEQAMMCGNDDNGGDDGNNDPRGK
jgi:hypothetical protein